MPELSLQERKKELRERIWKYLEDNDLARFPRPVFNRIPNFVGAAQAAMRVLELKDFRNADSVKVNPDAPQAYVRRIVLEEGKTLLMPTPRLTSGFLRLDPRRIPKHLIGRATSISGAFKFAERISLSDLPRIDLIVAGSVAVSLEGGRIGKGEGYSEIEYGILRERGLIDDNARIVTTVHDCQIVDAFKVEKHDLPVDYVLTPTKLHETNTRLPRPKGIYWDLVTAETLRDIPILEELKASISRNKTRA
jgi:5-formyltetrahydrofolate cyclo-ligase